MDQRKIGQFIKTLRKQNHLTQQQLAEKYGVTYQAVSKWENGNNLPDISLLKQMSEDFGISLDEILNGEVLLQRKKQMQKRNMLWILIICLSLVAIFLTAWFLSRDDFKVKVLSAECKDFKLTGMIAYNRNKSSIHISQIEYCGDDPEEKYKEIYCHLYEVHDKKEAKISTNHRVLEKGMTLEEYLKEVSFTIGSYTQLCESFPNGSLYLEIEGKTVAGEEHKYEIPLAFRSCQND